MSISIIGVLCAIATLLYIGENYKNIEKCRWTFFKWMILSAILSNVGFIIQIGITLRYFIFFELLFIFMSCVLCYRNKLHIFYNNVAFALLISAYILFNVIYLLYYDNFPYVPLGDYDTSFVSGGYIPMGYPQLTKAGIASIGWFLLFIVSLCLSVDYFKNKEKVYELLDFIKSGFQVLMIYSILEYFSAILFGEYSLRSLFLQLIGIGTDSSIFLTTQQRGLFLSISGWYSEPSYYVTFIIYYIYEWKYGIRTYSDMFFHCLSIIVLVFTSSASAFTVIPFGLGLNVFYLYSGKKYFNKLKFINAFFLTILLFSVCVLLYLYQDNVLVAWNYIEGKIFSYISGEQSTLYAGGDASGAIRYLGNNAVWDTFMKEPWLGVGIGTIKGFSALSVFLADFGILGIIGYVLFLNSIFEFSFYKENVVYLCIFLFYLSVAFQEYNFYTPWIIPVCLLVKDREVL